MSISSSLMAMELWTLLYGNRTPCGMMMLDIINEPDWAIRSMLNGEV